MKPMHAHELTVTYGTSRAADTYGYTLVTLRECGQIKARCNGGGYDMRGTVFADWLQTEYQDRLMTLAKKRGAFAFCKWNGKAGEASNYDRGPEDRRAGYYGATYYPKGSPAWGDKPARAARVELDGGCGLESIRRIAEAIGLSVRIIGAGKKMDIITITDKATW